MHSTLQNPTRKLDLAGLLADLELKPARAAELVGITSEQMNHLIRGRHGTTIDRAQLMAVRWRRATRRPLTVDTVLSAVARSRARFLRRHGRK